MKNEWRATSFKILGRKAICHVADRSDRMLVGKYGIIYPYNDHIWTIQCSNSHIISKRMPLHREGNKGAEIAFRTSDKQEALTWIKWLRIPNSRPGMIKLAEKLSCDG